MAEQTEALLPTIKENVGHLPVVVVIMAIAYDVGYFVGIDASYFTFFSLSEHIVFAFQALPVVMIAVMLVGVGLALHKYIPQKLGGIFYYLGLGTIFVACAFFLMRFYFAFVFALLVGSLVTAFWSDVIFKGVSRGFIVAALLVLNSVAIGRAASIVHLSDADAVQKIRIREVGEMRVVLIRSGERGILLYVPEARSFEFWGWDRVVNIEKQK